MIENIFNKEIGKISSCPYSIYGGSGQCTHEEIECLDIKYVENCKIRKKMKEPDYLNIIKETFAINVARGFLK